MRWSETIHQLFKIAEPYLVVRGDILHAKVAHEYARILMEKEGGEKKIIEPAIILHDVGWSSLTPQQISLAFGVRAGGKKALQLNRLHEQKGVVIAEKILQTFTFDTHLAEKIAVIIGRHDSGKQAHSVEEKIVKDADKLWRFSKIGFRSEIERQVLTPRVLYQYLSKRYTKWFFTDTAMVIARKELSNRKSEILQIEGKEDWD